MAAFVRVEIANPEQNRPQWGRLDSWKTTFSCIPFVGTFFERLRDDGFNRLLGEAINRERKIELIQFKNGNKICGAVCDALTATAFFLLAQHEFSVGSVTAPVISYIEGAVSVASLVMRPIAIWRNWQLITGLGEVV